MKTLPRLILKKTTLIAVWLTLSLHAEPLKVEVRGSQLVGPAQQKTSDPAWLTGLNNWKLDTTGTTSEWLTVMRAWRQERLAKINYDDAQYRRPELLWTQRNFVQPQAMVEDRYFYDPVERKYTVNRYLDDLNLRYGGIDSVLLWPVYPNIGIDNRNQWDLIRDMPGGVAGLRAMIQDFHHRGVKVFFPTMPWATGSRDEGMANAEAIAKLMAEIGADGVNGDTMNGVPLEYRTASDATGHPVAFEPELSPKDDAMLAYNQQSWAYWGYPFVPLVSKWKWLEPRHMLNVCDRWSTDHNNVLQAAFFNGVGIESWENIWGYWNQITPRNAETIRRIATIYRALPELLVSKDWTPHVPTLHYGVYASSFPVAERTLWTIVNRNEFDVSEGLMSVAHQPNRHYYDLWHGTEISPRIEGNRAFLSVALEPRGFGAVLAVDAEGKTSDLQTLLKTMQTLSAKPLQSYSNEWHFLPQQIVPIKTTTPIATAPRGMVLIPGGDFNFRVTGVEIEGENKIGLDVQYPWESSPRRGHSHRLTLKPFFIDRYPVTNAEFKTFVDAAHYRPADDHNFLKHWLKGAPRTGEENCPVIWVSLEDARAYAIWAGKRLPHEWEWQYAAQGTDERLYPWGNTWDETAVPTPYQGRDLPAPSAVDAHPKGASVFGVEDLVGNVWQWTDEFVDEHTRAAILRGGSFYQPQGSLWYFPQTYKLTEHGKYLLMAPSKDRAGTLGFRCVQDAL